MLQIQFKVRAEAQPHECIKIVGSLPSLGNWNPEFGLKLQKTHLSEWESIQPIEAAEGVKFHFKLVRVGSTIEWEKLPNNSNRTFKPKFRSKLIILWNQAEGKVFNQSKNSYKVKGLPAALIKTRKVEKKSSVFDPYHIAKINSDQENKDEDNFGFLQKKITIKPKLSKDDIEEIYYDTSQTEMIVGCPKKLKIYLISKQLNLEDDFQMKIKDQVEEIEQASIQWLYLNTNMLKIPKMKKINFHCIYAQIMNLSGNSLFSLGQLSHKHSFFIFLDLQLIHKIQLADAIASLYLEGRHYQQLYNKINFLSKFKHIVFDDHSKNQQFYEFLTERNASQSQIQQSDAQPFNIDKQIDNPNIQSLIYELKIDHFGKAVKLNTVYTISISQTLQKIQQPNSFLIIDDELAKVNPDFFNILINDGIKGRVIAVVSQGSAPQNIKKFSEKNIISVSNNFTKFRMKGKSHRPIQKHNQISQMIIMKAKLIQQAFGGEWQFKQNYMIYKNGEKQELLYKIEKEVKGMIKDFNYFKINVKNGRIKLSWSLAPQVRLIRTLCRLKYLSEGKIGNFYIISVSKNFQQLKDQIKLLTQSKGQFLEYGLSTKVKYFNYGSAISGNYTIIKDKPI